jgi:hypothetical protein
MTQARDDAAGRRTAGSAASPPTWPSALADGTMAGLVSWRTSKAGGPEGGRLEIGALLVENPAEQRVLEQVGFRREGVMRGLAFIGGRWRDGVPYARLRGRSCVTAASTMP